MLNWMNKLLSKTTTGEKEDVMKEAKRIKPTTQHKLREDDDTYGMRIDPIHDITTKDVIDSIILGLFIIAVFAIVIIRNT